MTPISPTEPPEDARLPSDLADALTRSLRTDAALSQDLAQHDRPQASAAERTTEQARDARLLARVRSRVMKQVAAASTSRMLTVPAQSGDWHPLLPGIELKLLREEGDSTSFLLRMQPGAVLPAHRHPDDEECIVLEGQVRIGHEIVLDAGGYHLAPKDVAHPNIETDTGCVLFLRGAAPSMEMMY